MQTPTLPLRHLARVLRFGGIALLLAAVLAPLPAPAANAARTVHAAKAVDDAEEAVDPRVDAAAARIDALYESVQWEVGEIVGIVDGDTADIRIGKRRLERLRLNEIDAPERGAPWSKRSTQLLADLIFGKEVLIAITDWDRDDRAVVRIFVWSDDETELLDVSQQMILRGAAWYFEKFSKDRALRAAEASARQAKAGLWSLPANQQVPPWIWRKMPKAERDLHR